MNAVERVRRQLWLIEAETYIAQVRRELRATPDDPELKWALHELLCAVFATRAKLDAACGQQQLARPAA